MPFQIYLILFQTQLNTEEVFDLIQFHTALILPQINPVQ